MGNKREKIKQNVNILSVVDWKDKGATTNPLEETQV